MDLSERKHHSNNGDWEWFKSFAGIGMPSNYYTFHLISKIIDANPQIKAIIELGTYWGSMAVYLGLEGARKYIPVFTFDICDQRDEETRRLFTKLEIAFFEKDILKQQQDVIDMVTKPIYLICDNGNKSDEFLEFGKHLPSGSVISVHDWGTEFYQRDADRLMSFRPIEPLWPEEWDKHNVQFATWLVL